MRNNIQRIKIGEWAIRFREPPNPGPHPVVWLFHGWKGDEDSMWIFAAQIPETYLILAPRGLYPEKSGGYSWYLPHMKGWPTVDVFKPVIDGLMTLMDNWPLSAPWGDFSLMRIAGFSQGAALAYAFATLFPEKISAVAGLAGFLPDDVESCAPNINFNQMPVYISHGRYDQIVPVSQAERAARFFTKAGAQVTFCESDVGHKLSADCFKGLEVFFN